MSTTTDDHAGELSGSRSHVELAGWLGLPADTDPDVLDAIVDGPHSGSAR